MTSQRFYFICLNRLLSDLVHSSQINATVHFPWSTPGADLGGNDRNAGAITKANRFV